MPGEKPALEQKGSKLEAMEVLIQLDKDRLVDQNSQLSRKSEKKIINTLNFLIKLKQINLYVFDSNLIWVQVLFSDTRGYFRCIFYMDHTIIYWHPFLVAVLHIEQELKIFMSNL